MQDVSWVTTEYCTGKLNELYNKFSLQVVKFFDTQTLHEDFYTIRDSKSNWRQAKKGFHIALKRWLDEIPNPTIVTKVSIDLTLNPYIKTITYSIRPL